MKIVCCPDSFKESMSAAQAARALATGVRRVLPDAHCLEIPMADGGEGFTAALIDALHASERLVPILNSIGEECVGMFALAGDRAVIDVAQAVGIGLVSPERRAVRTMTTYGVGQLILAAIDAGATEILVGLGGTGTNDGGAGMMRALGMRLRDPEGNTLIGSPESLAKIAVIDEAGIDPRLKDISFRVACDVDNPLVGERGASAIYGPQKGASPEDVQFLDTALAAWATVTGHKESTEIPGAGAAGGLGFAFHALLGAALEPGVDVVAHVVGLNDAINGADLVLTGEGAIDRQTLMGKTLSGILRRSTQAGVPVIAFAGRIGDGAYALYQHGCAGIVPIVDRVTNLADALANGPENLANAAERTMRLLTAGQLLSTHS